MFLVNINATSTLRQDKIEDVTAEGMVDVYKVNCVAPLMIAKVIKNRLAPVTLK